MVYKKLAFSLSIELETPNVIRYACSLTSLSTENYEFEIWSFTYSTLFELIEF